MWSGRTQRRAFASTPERRNGNINLGKYFISSSGARTHNQSVLQSHFVPLRHDWPTESNMHLKIMFGWKLEIYISLGQFIEKKEYEEINLQHSVGQNLVTLWTLITLHDKVVII